MRTCIPGFMSLLLGLACVSAAYARKLIVDTDLFSDVDDAGALLLACTLPDIELLAVQVNYPSTYSALAASSLLGYYGYPHVPIGLEQPYNDSTYLDNFYFEHGEYASKIAYHWQQHASLPWGDVTDTWLPTQLYRKILAENDDQSITIASIGFLNNLSNLLNSSPDIYSPLSGAELVTAKVADLVIMGGRYPSGHEYNFFGYNSTATAHVVNSWPGPMTFLGAEVGEDVYSGGRLMTNGPSTDPVKAAYEWYNGYNNSRFSWDPLTVLYAAQGKGRMFEFGAHGGHNHVYPNGSNIWRNLSSTYPQHYLRLSVSNATAGEVLDDLYLRGAAMFAAASHGP